MKKCLHFLSLVMVLVLTMSMSIVAYAADLSVNGLPTTVTVTSKNDEEGSGSWTVEDQTIVGQAAGGRALFGWAGKTTLTLKFAQKGEISFDWSLFNATAESTIQVDDTEYKNEASGHFVKEVEAGSFINVVLTAPKPGGLLGSTSANSCISNIRFVPYVAVDMTFNPVEGLSYVVEGTTINMETGSQTVTIPEKSEYFNVESTYTVEGVKIREWQTPDGKAYAYDDKTVKKPESALTLTPVLRDPNLAGFRVESTGLTFYDWDEALANANGNSTITVISSCTLPVDDYVIPKGVTLLIPFNTDRTLITKNMEENLYWDYRTEPAKEEYIGVRLLPDTTITVQDGGAISIGSRAHKMMVGQVGAYGAIHMDEGSQIILKSGSNLYAWGYIFRGDGKGGTVTAEGGSTVYENFMIMDYTGDAGVALDVYGNEGSGVLQVGKNTDGGHAFPVRGITVRNVEVPLTFHYGAKNYGFYNLYGNLAGNHNGYYPFIGEESENAILQLGSEDATISRSYKDGKMYMEIDGNAGFGRMSLYISTGLASATVESEKAHGMYLPTGFVVDILRGTASLKGSWIMTEGVVINIHEGAVLDTNGYKFYIMDATEDAGANPAVDVHGTSYGVIDKDAILNVNGTFRVTNGLCYTSQSGAAVISSEGTGRIEVKGTYQTSYDLPLKTGTRGKGTVTVVPLMMRHADETYLPIALDANNTIDRVYAYGNGKWICETHTPGEWVTDSEPTCAVVGSQHTTCTVCHTVVTETIPALSHSWSDATCTAPKTCSLCGKTEGESLGHEWADADCDTPKTCSVCGATEGEALGHSWSDATCTAPKTCSVCGVTEGEALGHNWSNATCTAPKTCSVCGATEGEALGHSWTDATCTTPKTCSVCGATEGEALGHSWTDATCTAPKTCSVCNATEGAALGHNWTDATCTAPKTCSVCGATEGEALGHKWNDATCTTPKTCSVCGATEGEALGHSWSDATCTAPKTCSVCGATEGEALGHNWTDATCTAPKTCSVCKTTEGEALGHNWTDATCTTPKTCSVCSATEGEALGHSWSDATCTAPKTCSVCGATEGEALGHKWTDATCTAPKTCSACGETEGEALGHNYVAPVITWIEGETVSATATVTCNVCEDGTEDKTLNVPAENVAVTAGETVGGNCQTKSSITYTATATYGKVTSTDRKTVYGELGNHNLTFQQRIDATCEAAGNEAYYACSVEGCGKYFSDAEGKNEIAKDSWIVNALGHTEETICAHVENTATHTVIVTCNICQKQVGEVATENCTDENSDGKCDKCGAEEPVTGYTVSGTIQSFGSETAPITVKLFAVGAEDASYEANVSGNTAFYTISGVAAGDYTMKVYKSAHMDFTTEVTVSGDVPQNVALTVGSGAIQFKLAGRNLSLSDNVNIKYGAQIPEGFTNVYMVYTMNGKNTVVDKYEIDENNGRYMFEFSGVNPQCMGDNVSATVYATCDGIEYSYNVAEFSVRSYCEGQLKKNISDKLKNLLSDLLVYGEKAQLYQGYKTNQLVTTGLESVMTPRTFNTLDASYNLQKMDGEKSNVADITGVALNLANEIRIKVVISTSDPYEYEYKVTVNSTTNTYTAEDLEYDAKTGKYNLYVKGVPASRFNLPVTVKIMDGDTQEGRTLTYSVFTYVQKNQNNTDTKLADMLKAIYNYGVSAQNYIA